MSKAMFFIFLLSVGSMIGPSFQDLFGQVQLPTKACDHTTRVLNDCNWCSCTKERKFVCMARDCHGVDMFGHFNDAIRDINVGMEGHGYWRTNPPSCKPNVHYTRNNLLCVCTEEGNWPSKVCNDIFKVLHPVLVTELSVPSNLQTCTQNTLYLIGCNVCYCPSSGSIDPELCTKKACSLDDPVLRFRTSELEHKAEGVVYAECDVDSSYRLGCRSCTCLRNNRLQCSQCVNGTQADCTGRKPGEPFAVQCNFCICDEQGQSMCTVKDCSESDPGPESRLREFTAAKVPPPEAEQKCEVGKYYKKECNHCFCVETEKGKVLSCTQKYCTNHHLRRNDPKFDNGELKINLDALNGNCEPFRAYRTDCNTCKCLSDGKTVECTTKNCNNLEERGVSEEKKAVEVDLLPFRLSAEGQCPKGHTFKIDCNFCYCLNNGNALCTTVQCKKRKWTLD